MVLSLLIFLATCFLAYSNGANDNFKGAATLFGSRTANYKAAIRWASLTTFAGSVCSLIWAGALVERFSGKGLVPDAVATSPDFLLAVALGAGFTVMVATRAGLPISTTHSLTGALVDGKWGSERSGYIQDTFVVALDASDRSHREWESLLDPSGLVKWPSEPKMGSSYRL